MIKNISLKSSAHFYKTISKLLTIIIITLIVYFSLFQYNILYNSIFKALDIWLYKVFPSLFLFYLISTLLISTNIINYLLIIFKPLKVFLKFETIEAFNLFFISIFLGNPSTITFINEYHENNIITHNDAQALTNSSSFINPLFVLALFDNKNLGLLVYLAHLISNFLIAVYLTNKYSRHSICSKNNTSSKSNINFFRQMNKFSLIILNIAIYITISNIFITISRLINIPTVFTLFIEVSTGANLSLSNYLYLLPSILSFNGLCIHLQVKQFLKFSYYKDFFIFRIIASIISFCLFNLILFFL